MKKQLTILAVLFWTVLGLEAQQSGIIYTDYEPDSLVELKEIDFNPDAQMMIDFDADGNNDLRIYSYATSGGWWFNIMSYSPDWEIHEYKIEDPLIPMNEQGEWYTGINWLPYFYQGQSTVSDKFAVRHQVGESYYYGWFRAYLLMNGTANPWVALDKMAYCTIPDYPLIWGQTEIENHILYTDFEPDTCVILETGGNTFTLDLNQDGDPDVFFSAYWHSAVGDIANMHVGNDWEFCDSDGGNPLTDTTIINNSLQWSHYSTDLAMYPDRTRFAFRHQTTDGYHYGWARIYVESRARVCISDMAYCTIPNYPLQWGQTNITNSVEENKETIDNAFTVYPNPTNGVLFVETRLIASLSGQNVYRIANMMGQTLLQGYITDETQQINIENLPAGMYFISVGEQTVKFVVR